MKHSYLKEEKEYLNSFINTTLDLSKFHHNEHLLITYTLLIDKNIKQTYQFVKEGILNILKKAEVDSSKYHATMTYGWILIVKYFMNKTKQCKSFEEFISLNNQLLDTNILYMHYSKNLINENESKTKIFNPDIQNINI